MYVGSSSNVQKAFISRINTALCILISDSSFLLWSCKYKVKRLTKLSSRLSNPYRTETFTRKVTKRTPLSGPKARRPILLHGEVLFFNSKIESVQFMTTQHMISVTCICNPVVRSLHPIQVQREHENTHAFNSTQLQAQQLGHSAPCFGYFYSN